MPISFSSLSGGASSEPDLIFCPAGRTYFDYEAEAGIYQIKAWAENYGTSPTVSITVRDQAVSETDSFSLIDNDPLVTNNPVIKTFRSTSAIGSFVILSNVNAWVSVEPLGAYKQGNPLTATIYSTSQQITFTKATRAALIGGGGGGKIWEPRDFGTGGGGGGSGYVEFLSITPGTYDLVCGAGGAGGTSGTSSTFNGITVAGGESGPYSVNGGNGGSGGGGGQISVTNSATAPSGGSNGANGGTSSDGQSGQGGQGSGVALEYFVTPGTGGGGGLSGGYGGTTRVSGGGGIYAGGGGGGNGWNVKGGAGGGGGGVLSGTGGTSTVLGQGGAGGLIVLDVD